MIDIAKERLLPLSEVAAYLQSRGFGRRVHVSAVYRWVKSGADGVRLESIPIGGTLVTSIEAIQRWVEARQSVRADSPAAAAPTARSLVGARMRRDAARRILDDARIGETELDRLSGTLDAGTAAVRAQVASALFRAGLRTVADARRVPVASLLRLPRIGPKAAQVVQALASRLSDVRGAQA